MRHKSQLRITLLLVAAVVVILILSNIGGLGDTDTLYFVTAEQWQAAFGDEAYIQTIYRNVTIEISNDAQQGDMFLATANGGLMLDDKTHDSKLVCVPTEDGFVSYIWQSTGKTWEKYDGKADSVDVFLNTYLPKHVDTAMTGLQGEFEKAVYSDEERCYTIFLQKDAASGEESATMYCRIFFENGKLIRLETEVLSDKTLTVRLYDIGCTEVKAPVE